MTSVEKKAESECFSVADMTALWPELYAQSRTQKWFQKLARFYYWFFSADETLPPTKTNSSSEHHQKSSIATVALPEFKNIYEQEAAYGKAEWDLLMSANLVQTPSDARWWIVPRCCTIINGVLLYVMMKRSSGNVTAASTADDSGKKYDKLCIYETESHVFLVDEADNTIYDLYWQPLGYHVDHEDVCSYRNAKRVQSPNHFFAKYDLAYSLMKQDALDLLVGI